MAEHFYAKHTFKPSWWPPKGGPVDYPRIACACERATRHYPMVRAICITGEGLVLSYLAPRGAEENARFAELGILIEQVPHCMIAEET